MVGRWHAASSGPNVRINSYSHVEDSILFDGVEVGRRCRLRRVIVDKGVRIPPETEIGYDPAADAARGLTVTSSGLVVIATRGRALGSSPGIDFSQSGIGDDNLDAVFPMIRDLWRGKRSDQRQFYVYGNSGVMAIGIIMAVLLLLARHGFGRAMLRAAAAGVTTNR